MIANNIVSTHAIQPDLKDYLISLNEEINQAAQILKEENNLPIESSAIARILAQWLSEQLEDIDWQYQHHSALKKAISKLELKQELDSNN